MRNLRCKVGDLAIITKCGVPERIGRLVRVVERCEDGQHDWNLTPIRGEYLTDEEEKREVCHG